MAESNKTEKATPKKRSDARKEGNVYQSRDITNAVSFIVIIFVMSLLIYPAFQIISKTIVGAFTDIQTFDTFNSITAVTMLRKIIIYILILIAPLGFLSAFLAVILTGSQTGFLFKMNRIKPKFSKLNPLSGFKKMFSFHSAFELFKSLLKVVIIASVVYTNISSLTDKIVSTSMFDLRKALLWLGESLNSLAMSTALYLAIFGAVDFFYQWRTYEKQLMMTKQEIKDEFKQSEGDPQVKGRIKDIQRKLASMRMMKNVKTADVIVRNPTHYAIALKYTPTKDRAPKVVAKGKGYVALKIIEEAEKHGIFMTENKPLARGLYDAAELEKQIPEEFFKPVAEILALLYKLKKKKAVGRNNLE